VNHGDARMATRAGAGSRNQAPTSVDCHAHVFTRTLAMADGRRYTPDYDATIADYLGMLDANGMSHGVLIQPSFLGSDNSYLLEALRTAPTRLRGIAAVDPEITPKRLEEMGRAGIVGVRLNLIGKPDPDFSEARWQTHLERLAKLGWQVEIQAEARRLPILLPPLLDHVTVVVDHFGLPDKTQGIRDPAFQWLLAVAGKARLYVKLSGAYRNGPGIAQAAAPLLLRAFGPQRLVWGSDWPHTGFEGETSPAQARIALDAWAPDGDARQAILSSSAARLFRFA
jgi:predicted TIM-barrel fold metal-dependent hydrolase